MVCVITTVVRKVVAWLLFQLKALHLRNYAVPTALTLARSNLPPCFVAQDTCSKQHVTWCRMRSTAVAAGPWNAPTTAGRHSDGG